MGTPECVNQAKKHSVLHNFKRRYHTIAGTTTLQLQKLIKHKRLFCLLIIKLEHKEYVCGVSACMLHKNVYNASHDHRSYYYTKQYYIRKRLYQASALFRGERGSF